MQRKASRARSVRKAETEHGSIRRNFRYPCVALLAVSMALCLHPANATEATGDLVDLSLEQLSQIQVTSVSKRQEMLLDAAASVFVITNEDIRMSGATSIPEALRLAPGVEVARKGSNTWSISIRGFNNDISNKLLVLIDGRSVYSPFFAGVFWDVQDLMLEDVDRIEVVAGPGGTLWGANAVNGVINIITRSAGDTQGGLAQASGGDEGESLAIRYGGQLANGASLRTYLKSTRRDASTNEAGTRGFDDWRMTQGGFRYDLAASPADRFTLQGDAYRGKVGGLFRGAFTLGTLPGPSFRDDSDLAGANLLARWTRQLDEDSDLSVQAYYDHTRRDIPSTFNESRDTFDAEFQHHFRRGRHDVLWGLGMRWTSDDVDSTLFATFDPARRTDRTYSAFVQDRIDLWNERLFLTLGSKFERNDYTGFESQPNARLTWLASERQTLWAAASRAVRIPSRLDADLRLTSPVSIPGLPFPIYVNINANHDFDSEELLAYEAGYRAQVRDNLSFDVSVFYNDYDQLQTTEPEQPVVVINPPVIYIVLPNSLANGMKGHSYGGTLAAKWSPVSNWRLQFQYSYFELHLRNLPGSLDTSALRAEGNSPRNQASLFSFLSLPGDVSVFAGARYVDALPNRGVDSYTAFDLGMSWTPHPNLSLSVAGKNLANRRHQEFSATGNPTGRSVQGNITFRF